MIIAIGGAVGTGKSTVAFLLRDKLAQRLKLTQTPDNRVRLLRSDLLRKQLLDIDPLHPLPDAYYENEQYGRLIYNTLHEVARISVDVGDSILLDATYTRRWQRASLEAIVNGTEFHGYWLEADPNERQRRLATRRKDPSDAGPDFSAKQHIERPINEPQWDCIEVSNIESNRLAEMLLVRIVGHASK